MKTDGSAGGGSTHMPTGREGKVGLVPAPFMPAKARLAPRCAPIGERLVVRVRVVNTKGGLYPPGLLLKSW